MARQEHVKVATKASWWKHQGRRWLLRALGVQIVAVLVFIGVLLVAEGSHVSFFALYLPRQPLLVVSIAATLVALFLKHRLLLACELALTLVVFFPVMGGRMTFPRSPSSPERAVRLATYNVYFGKGGRPALLDEIAAMPADIIVLQATYDSIGDRLRERFPDRTTRQEGELVIISRFPIAQVEVPGPLAGDVRPMFVMYVLDTPAGPLRVFNMHPFSPRNALVDRDEAWSVDVARREAQVAAVAAAAREPGPPFLIVGDTNLPQLSAILHRHLGDLTDAFEQTGVGLGYTFPARRPWMRIDRVFAGAGVTFTTTRVGPKGASDHRPLFVELEIAR